MGRFTNNLNKAGVGSTLTYASNNYADNRKIVSIAQEDKLGSETKNYSAWRTILEGIFDYNGCMDIVDGTRPMPLNQGPELLEWKSLHNYAYTQLLVALDKNFFNSLDTPPRETNRAHNLWSQIIQIKSKSSETDKLLIRQKIDNCRMREYQDVSRHVVNMKEIRKEGEEVGCTMSDQEFKLAFFMSLPASWKTFITQQMNCSDMNTIYAEAKVHQQFHKNHDKILHSSNAYGQRRDFARQVNTNARVGCSNCGYKNHEFKVLEDHVMHLF